MSHEEDDVAGPSVAEEPPTDDRADGAPGGRGPEGEELSLEPEPIDETPAVEEPASAEGEVPPMPGADQDSGPGLEQARPALASEHLKAVLESLIFVSDKPVTIRRLTRITKSTALEVRPLLKELMEDYAGRGIELLEVAGGYQFRSAPASAPFVRELVARKPVRLSRAQLETLAIVAYRQPLTRPEVEEIRGVDSASALKILLERGVVKVLGRKDEPGRPLLYGTAPIFLELFGLRSLEELPTLKEFTELTEESRALFARRSGESLEGLGDLEVPEVRASVEGEDGEGAEAAGAEGETARAGDAPADEAGAAPDRGDDLAPAPGEEAGSARDAASDPHPEDQEDVQEEEDDPDEDGDGEDDLDEDGEDDLDEDEEDDLDEDEEDDALAEDDGV